MYIQLVKSDVSGTSGIVKTFIMNKLHPAMTSQSGMEWDTGSPLMLVGHHKHTTPKLCAVHVDISNEPRQR